MENAARPPVPLVSRRGFLALACGSALGACAPFSATIFDAPPAGLAWDNARLRFAAPDVVERAVAGADIALLGETHDNAEHHAIQLRLLRAAVAAGRRPAVAFEQIDAEWQAAVDAALGTGTTPRALAAAAHVGAGWSWPLYEAIAGLALQARLPIVAIGFSRERARRVVAEGFSALGPGESARLAIESPWNALMNARLRREIVEGHCGEDSPIVDKLVLAQRARDAVMADRILQRSGDGLIAILGRGHARADIAVPLYLAARTGARRVVSVGITETRPEATRPEDYPETAPGRFDFVWFTPAASRPDPCEGFRLPGGK
jgi:uncharacterized iron-regulated protein